EDEVRASDDLWRLEDLCVFEINAADIAATNDANFDGLHVFFTPCADYFALIQSSPMPASALRGTLRDMARSRPSTTRCAKASPSSAGHSKTSSSWIWRRSLRGSCSRSIRSCRLTIATLMRSAALPCTTELIASRSPSARRALLLERISGIARRRPKMVVT